MNSSHACPSCGETESLRGAGAGDDIEITCGHCGHHWIRCGPACRTCGGNEVATIPQVLARTSRGNQLSIMGHRDVTLCVECDSEMIASCKTSRHWVPEDYSSAYLSDRKAARPEPQGSPKPAPRPEHAPAPNPQNVRAAPSKPAAKPQTVRPTVRQAISEHMTASSGADPLAMLSLGQHLGPSTRLEDISRAEAGAALKAWFVATWAEHDSDRRAAVRSSVVDAYAFWLEKGWITNDPSADLPS